MSYEMMPTLLAVRDVFAGISGVQSCRIGLESNLSPSDYPMIRVVPFRLTPGRPYAGRTIEVYVYFGAALVEPEGELTDPTTLAGLETVYAALSTMEADILEALKSIDGRYIETVTDQDRFTAYKVMAVRCEITAALSKDRLVATTPITGAATFPGPTVT